MLSEIKRSSCSCQSNYYLSFVISLQILGSHSFFCCPARTSFRFVQRWWCILDSLIRKLKSYLLHFAPTDESFIKVKFKKSSHGSIQQLTLLERGLFHFCKGNMWWGFNFLKNTDQKSVPQFLAYIQ